MRIHPKKILWPTDFSPLSLKGGEYARVFSDTFRARLHVIHVAPLVVFDATTAMMTAGDKIVGATDTVGPAQAAMRKLLSRHFDDPSQIRSKVLVGQAWYEICSYAQAEAIDLIVIATHGLTGFKHLLMGSTSERVVQHAPCPVLTVKSVQRGFLRSAETEMRRVSARSAGKRAGRNVSTAVQSTRR